MFLRHNDQLGCPIPPHYLLQCFCLRCLTRSYLVLNTSPHSTQLGRPCSCFDFMWFLRATFVNVTYSHISQANNSLLSLNSLGREVVDLDFNFNITKQIRIGNSRTFFENILIYLFGFLLSCCYHLLTLVGFPSARHLEEGCPDLAEGYPDLEYPSLNHRPLTFQTLHLFSFLSHGFFFPVPVRSTVPGLVLLFPVQGIVLPFPVQDHVFLFLRQDQDNHLLPVPAP